MASIAAFEGFENKETQKAAQCGEKKERYFSSFQSKIPSKR